MAHPNHLSNTHVFIFGGTSGIGFGVANMALSNNATVTISGSTQKKVDAKVALLRSYYPDLPADRVSGYACDLSDMSNLEANLTALFNAATNKGENKINHIVFTAGAALALPRIENVTPDQMLAGLHTRLIPPTIIAKILVSTSGTYMPVSSRSSLTLTGGVNSQKPMPGWFAAAAWGTAVEGLTRGLAVDMKPIRVNMVEPGAVDTELMAPLGEEGKAVWARLTLAGELGRVEDVAEAYGWCMRDGFVTGSVAATNGGRLLVG